MKNKLIDQIKTFYRNHNKIPSSNDYKKFPGEIYPHSVYKKYFGSFNSAIIEAGFEPFKRARKERLCIQCRINITNMPYSNKFCSRSCSAKHRNKNNISVSICKQCRSSFKPKKKDQKYCSIQCRNDGYINNTISLFESGQLSSSTSIRKAITHIRGYKCEICDISEWRSSSIVLECDHIDGNPDNNHPSNLRLLCPNCHSQTSTFRFYNRNNLKSDRRSKTRRKYYHAREPGSSTAH